MGNQKKAQRNFQILSTDYIGPLPRSTNGFRWILVVSDIFSKFILTKAMRTATSKATTNFFETDIFTRFAVPEIIISDNGPQFKSREFKEMLNYRNIKHWPTCYYHPQANQTEAANKTIGNALRAYVDKNHRNWDHRLPQITCAINTSVHSSTKMTPYKTVFGHEMITDNRVYRNCSTEERVGDHQIDEELAKIQRHVMKNLTKTHTKMKHYYDLRARPMSFKKGQIIWWRNFVQSDAIKGLSAKLAPKFIKCQITEVLGNNSFRVKDIEGKYVGHFNAKDLKP